MIDVRFKCSELCLPLGFHRGGWNYLGGEKWMKGFFDQEFLSSLTEHFASILKNCNPEMMRKPGTKFWAQFLFLFLFVWHEVAQVNLLSFRRYFSCLDSAFPMIFCLCPSTHYTYGLCILRERGIRTWVWMCFVLFFNTWALVVVLLGM